MTGFRDSIHVFCIAEIIGPYQDLIDSSQQHLSKARSLCLVFSSRTQWKQSDNTLHNGYSDHPQFRDRHTFSLKISAVNYSLNILLKGWKVTITSAFRTKIDLHPQEWQILIHKLSWSHTARLLSTGTRSGPHGILFCSRTTHLNHLIDILKG